VALGWGALYSNSTVSASTAVGASALYWNTSGTNNTALGFHSLFNNNLYEKIRYSGGFIAQEVEQAANMIGYDFSGVDAPKNDKDLYALRYAEFVIPLVKAVQEQQQQLNEMRIEIALLKEQNNVLLQLLHQNK
jgi:hypothetical protein